MRKVKQITSNNQRVFALCEDGTMWQMSEHQPEWNRIPDIPDESRTIPKVAPVPPVMSPNEFSNFRVLLDFAVDTNDNGGILRNGQVYFNTLYKNYPAIANEIRGSKYDPFHDDRRINDFMDHIRKDYVL